MKKRFLMLGAVGASLISGVAFAAIQDAPPPPPPGGIFADADANNDGRITREEFQAAVAARFARVDANHDGQITQEERAAQREERREQRTAQREERRAARTTQQNAGQAADRAPDERRGGPGGRRMGPPPGGRGAPMAERVDTNHDGKVSLAEEQAAATQMFDRIDANHDGVIEQSERPAMRGPMGPGGHRGPGGRPGCPCPPPGDDMPPPPPPADAPDEAPSGN